MKQLRLCLIGLSIGLLLAAGQSAFAAQILGLRPGGSGSTNLLDIRTSPFSVSTIGAAGGGQRLSGLDRQPGTGQLFASSGFGGTNLASLFSINGKTGVASLIGSSGFAGVPGLAFDSDGTLYGSASDDPNEFADRLVTIDPGTGVGTLVGLFGTGFEGMDALAVDPISGTLFGAGAGANFSSLFTINKLTGAATELGELFEAGTGLEMPEPLVGLTFDPWGGLYGSLGNGDGRIITIDAANLQFTLVGDAANGSVSDIVFVPEPSSLALFGLGVSLLGWRRRQRAAW